MTQIALLALMVYAACGFIVSSAVHLLALAGLQPHDHVLMIGLTVGIFALWLPVTPILLKLGTGVSRKDVWKVLYSGCPTWMLHANKILNAYAIANFAIVTVMFFVLPTWLASTDDVPRWFWLLFSSYMMLFYFGGLGTLITAQQKGYANLQLKCLNGHIIGYSDRYCPTCGTPTR